MFDDISNGGEAAIAVRAGTDFQRVIAMLLEPGVPLLALPFGVIHQVGEVECGGHDDLQGAEVGPKSSWAK